MLTEDSVNMMMVSRGFFQHSTSDQFSVHEGVAESEYPKGADVVGKASRVRESFYSRQREARD